MSDAPRVTVLGYASMDYSMNVNEPPLAGRTSLVTQRLSTPWPDCGGAARFVRPLARSGVHVSVISWVGTDAAGEQWIESVTADGAMLTEGSQMPGTSPVSYLVHCGSDLPACVFDPGITSEAEVELSAEMKRAITNSDWCLCSVAPPSAVRALLAQLPATGRLAWVVKADSNAFPTDLRRELWARSSLVVLGEAEVEFLEEADIDLSFHQGQPSAPMIVRTSGSSNVTWSRADQQGVVPVEPIGTPVNTVGAGDVFAGALLAALIARDAAQEWQPDQMVDEATREARQFLIKRSMP
jgi:ribokinase